MNAGPMKADLITDLGGIPAIEEDWRRLAELRGNAFVTPEWFVSWWAHEGGSSTPLIVAVRRSDGSLAGVMPLVLDSSTRPHSVRFAGGGLGDRFHPAARPEDGPEVGEVAMAALEDAGLSRRMLLLEKVDVELEFWRRMKAGARRALAAIELQKAPMPYATLEGLDWDGYLAQRRGKFRGELRRRDRVLRRDHDVRFRIADDSTFEADLAELLRLHDLRWRRASSLSNPKRREAVRAFAAAARRRGWLRLGVLEVDDAPVAATLCWRVGDAYSGYQGGFDPAWGKRSVGILLVAHMIRNAIEEGATEFDFLLGAEDYKRGFTSTARTATTLALIGSLAPSRMLVACEVGARRVARRMRSRPGVGRLLRPLAHNLPVAGAD